MAAAADRQQIDFNLETVEREKTYSPFTAYIPATDGGEGRTLTMTDPSEIDWQDLLEVDQPQKFLRYCITDEDRDWLVKQKIKGWQFGKLIDAYMRHYGLDRPGNAAGSRI
jgi:hypothetical protein